MKTNGPYAGDLGGLVICKKVWDVRDWIRERDTSQ
jgi:hypothetical protein